MNEKAIDAFLQNKKKRERRHFAETSGNHRQLIFKSQTVTRWSSTGPPNAREAKPQSPQFYETRPHIQSQTWGELPMILEEVTRNGYEINCSFPTYVNTSLFELRRSLILGFRRTLASLLKRYNMW